MIHYLLLGIFVIVMILMIIVILLQKARGGGLVGALGAGGSETALGALGDKEMVKFTTWLAIGFFALAVLLDFFPPERHSADLHINTVSNGKIPHYDDNAEGTAPSSEEAPLKGGTEGTADNDLLGGDLTTEQSSTSNTEPPSGTNQGP